MRQMKDSGVEWLGEIPADWALRQAGQLADQTKMPNEGMAETNLLSLSYGKVKRRDINATDGLLPDSFETYNIIEPDDIVLRFTDLQNDQKSLRVGRATERGIITSAYVTVRPFDPSCSRFMYYALHSYDLCKGFYGMGAGVRQGLKWQEARYILLPWPDKDEQTRIADFLDAKCAEIDRAVSAAEQSIQEYKAYKSSVIFQAVTKGLDPTAPMKDSGIEWLGEVPAGWQVRYPKFLFAARKERARADDIMLTASQHHGMIPQRQFMEKESYAPVPVEKGHDILKHVEPGDFIISMRSFQGGLEYSAMRGKMSSAYLALYPIDNCVDDRYYRWLFKSQGYIQGLQTTTNLVRDGQALRYANFLKVWLPMPPLEQQSAIASFLDAKCAEIDSLVEAKQAIIDELKSYKQSLIYEAVTGKLEV